MKLDLYRYDHDLPEDRLDLVNTGHTLSCKLRGSDESPNDGSPGLYFQQEFYQFSELHFHWDANDTQGSDHTIGGYRFAMELHLVHYNTKYKGYWDAVGRKDGLLVLAVLMTAGSEASDALQPILKKIGDVVLPHMPTFMQSPMNLRNLLPAQRLQLFYSYIGSLTTPPCSEPVSWIVFVDNMSISWQQLTDFQRLSSGENKRRDVQATNDRLIRVSSMDHCKA